MPETDSQRHTAPSRKGSAHTEPIKVIRAPSARVLAQLCDRLSLSLESGIDLRRVLKSEISRTSGALSEALRHASETVEQGGSFAEALAERSECLPSLFIEMARVGELTGSTPEVFRRLGKHYEQRALLQKQFLAGLAWPMIQLLAALAVVGLLILVGGISGNNKIDMLGFGLVGTRGLVIYLNLLIGISLLLGMGYLALQRYPALKDRLMLSLSKVPYVGPCLQKFALAKIAWALHLTMNVELDLRKVAPLVLKASDSPNFTRHVGSVTKSVGAGNPLSLAFAPTGEFPRDFIDSLHVAEETGQISESMERLSKQYEEQAQDSLSTLTKIFAGAIWLMVAGLVVMLIFRVFGFYLGVINDAVNQI